MAISIYHFPTPVLELSLVAGGSLTPNTTYYFTCRYHGSVMGHGPLATQASITTDTTNLTINVKIKWDTGGGSYSYNRPTLPYGLAYYYVVWDTADMTDGAGNYNFTTSNIAMLTGTATTYDVNYSTNPSKARQYYTYIPELYHYLAEPVLPAGWSKTEGQPIIYSSSASDTWANVYTAILADGMSNFLFLRQDVLMIMASFYFGHTVTMNDLDVVCYYGNFYSLGTHDRCVLYTQCGGGYGATGAGFSITSADDTILKGNRYRQGFLITGLNNSIYAFNGQVSLTTNDSSERKFIKAFLLTNGFNNNNNWQAINSCVYDQIMSSDETISNIYQKVDTAEIAWAYDWVMYNGFNNSPTTLTINNFSIDTNRITSEGIDYSGDKKPRINWSVATGTYVYKTLAFRNSVEFYITDEDGNPIEGANIEMSNGFETVDDDTDSDGYLEQYIKIRTAVMDTAYSASTYYTTWTDEEEVDVTITKAGYETYTAKMNLINTTEAYITLKSAIDVCVTNKGIGIKVNPENSGNDREVVILP
jgi:hypothetical protein